MKKVIVFLLLLFVNINYIYAKEVVKYSGCVDGDTIKVKIKNEEKIVRLLAIDTPESVKPNTEVEYYGKEASEYTCKQIQNAKKISLEYDDNSDKEDKYGRILAWVFVDDKLLQSVLVEYGYAKVAYLYNDYKYTDTLMEKQELASAKGIGIWNNQDKDNFNENLGTDISNTIDEYSNKEIIIIVILFLIIVFISDKTVKRRAKKKLKNYL